MLSMEGAYKLFRPLMMDTDFKAPPKKRIFSPAHPTIEFL